MVQPFRRIRTTDRDLSKVQDAVAGPLRDVVTNKIINGTLVTDVALASATTTILNHKLGKTPQGYIVVKKSAAATIYDTEFTATTMTLHSSAAVTVSLWVF